MADDPLRLISPHWDYVDAVSDYLVQLFHAVRRGEKAFNAAERLSSSRRSTWSTQLNQDLIRAVKILVAAWKFKGKTTSFYAVQHPRDQSQFQ